MGPHRFGYIKYKYRNNRLDYTPYIYAIVLPINNDSAFRKAIYILSNNRAGSTAEIPILALMTLPNSTVAGTNTRGALGLLVNNDILTMEDRLKWGTSGREHNFTSISDLELRNYERIGLTPDVHIEHEGNIIDKQLEISN